MTLPAPLAKSLLMAASIGLIVPILAQPSAAAAAASASDPAGEEPKVVGVERPWSDGFLGLAVEGNAFVLRFYDAERRPLPVAAARAAVRWDPVGRAGTDRAVLNPADGTLRSPSVVRPPLIFTAFITLLDEAGESLGTQAFNLSELK